MIVPSGVHWLLWILFGLAVFWLWVFFGSRSHCPRCGRDLTEEYGLETGTGRLRRTRTSCGCGWHEGMAR